MGNPNLSKHTVPFGWSLALCAVLNALLVIAKEKSKVISDLMQKAAGHHWITHVAIVFFAFISFGFIFGLANGGQGPKMPIRRLTNLVVIGVIAGVVIVLGFYLVAD